MIRRTLDRVFLAWCKVRRWFKCRVRGLHYYKFVEKVHDGSRLLRCTRCGKWQFTKRRKVLA